MVIFLVAAAFAARIPRMRTTQTPGDAELERTELHQPSILLAGSAMAILRGAVGFLQFFAAFTFKNDLFALGTVATAAGIGLFGGNLIAPRLRKHLREEMILAGSLLVCAATTLFAVVFARHAGDPALVPRRRPRRRRRQDRASTASCNATGPTRCAAARSPASRPGSRPRGCSARCSASSRSPSAAGLGVLGLVLAFGGLSYLAALRAARERAEPLEAAPRGGRPRPRSGPPEHQAAPPPEAAGRRRGARAARRRAAAEPRTARLRPAAPQPPRGAASSGQPVTPPPRRRPSGHQRALAKSCGGRRPRRASICHRDRHLPGRDRRRAPRLRTRLALGFGESPNVEQHPRWYGLDPERVIAGFDGDDIVATCRNYSLELTVPGGAILPAAGVSAVTVPPDAPAPRPAAHDDGRAARRRG